MKFKIALVGNPNSGKTTLFNDLTGGNQIVGNWPGVTVSKKEGKYKADKDITIVDLPGIYSLSPYTLEEVIARKYLLEDRPDLIINIVDATNLERNLYLSTQISELNIPIIMALNMMDVVNKREIKIDVLKLAEHMGCKIIPVSALKHEGTKEIIIVAKEMITNKMHDNNMYRYSKKIEPKIKEIENLIKNVISENDLRWYGVKFFERDSKVLKAIKLNKDISVKIESIIQKSEKEMDDDSESIITDERYQFVSSVAKECVKHKGGHKKQTATDKIDKIVTNRWAAIPIFIAIMFAVYYISVTTVGAIFTDFVNNKLFGEWIVGGLHTWLTNINVASWLQGLLVDGIISGIGSVLSFIPQLLVLFIFLAFLEECGYMSRIAFVLDRIFRKFGLSGKSFIPMLIGTGCSVPGIMASRTIENERDRRMTIMTTSFMPCSAKLPIIALIAGALLGGAWWAAPSAYFMGILAIIISGVMLKKTKPFAGEAAPFVMELPDYHWPTVGAVFRSMWERAWSFIKKAGTVILLATIVIWYTSNFNWIFQMTSFENSILYDIGDVLHWIFVPLGFGKGTAGVIASVATITGLVAKETVVATLGILYGAASIGEAGEGIWTSIAANYTALAGYSFLVFNLLCTPCFAAIGAIRREMNNKKWTWFAVIYQTIFAYVITLIIYNIGTIFSSQDSINIVWLILALASLCVMGYMLFRKNKYEDVIGTLAVEEDK